MPTADLTSDAPDLSRFAECQPELGWAAFMVATMVLLHDLGESALQMHATATASQGEGPEQATDALLDNLYAMAAQATFDPRVAEMTIDGVQVALYRNITAPARFGSWTALAAAMREAACEVAATVTGIADEYGELLAELEAQDTLSDAERESIMPLRNTIATMRFLVDQVRYRRPPGQA